MTDLSVPQTVTKPSALVPAYRHLGSHLRFWMVGAVLLSADLWSKEKVFRTLEPSETVTVVPNVLEFRRSLNDGAVFGSFTGYVGLFIAASVFALGFVIYLFAAGKHKQWAQQLALGMILAGATGNLYDRWTQVADIVTYSTSSGREVSIIGRVVGDPSDKNVRVGAWPEGTHEQVFSRSQVQIRRQGVVRDFLKFVPEFPTWVPRLGGLDIWPWIFNVADAALVCGVFLLLGGSWLERKFGAADHECAESP
ncbi:MAG: signal peptidase II [Planctomycetota bacterium]